MRFAFQTVPTEHDHPDVHGSGEAHDGEHKTVAPTDAALSPWLMDLPSLAKSLNVSVLRWDCAVSCVSDLILALFSG